MIIPQYLHMQPRKPLFACIITLALCLISTATVSAAPVSGFEAGRIIDDDVFTASGSMNTSQIQAFLNSKVPVCDTWGTQSSEFGGGTRAQWGSARGHSPPYICLKDFTEAGKTAAQIIYDTGQEFRINPQVLIVLLQKEQGLVTDTWPLSTQYRTATGYGCPDSTPGVCDSSYYGFTNQLRWAARMFRAILNNSPTWYTPYLMGNNFIQWNPQSSCGGTTVNITTSATRALYNYTPYQPNAASLAAGYGTGDSCSSYGNRNFYLYFTDWFGSTKGSSYHTCRGGSNLQGVDSGRKLLRMRLNSRGDNIALGIANNTGTACVEVHTWANNSLQAWLQHIGTNSYTFDSSHSAIVSSKISRTESRLFKVDYRHTSSGRLEIHGWHNDLQHWTAHIASNAGPVDPANSEVIFADLDGNGLSDPYLIDYTGTSSGMTEVHGWTQDLQHWNLHAATNMPIVNTSEGRIIPADLDGNGSDELSYIKYANTESGYVEMHTWAANLKQWVRHAATNLPAASFSRQNDDIFVADTNGDSRDELYYIKYSTTASGRVEVHGWSPNQQYWISHTATSSGSF